MLVKRLSVVAGRLVIICALVVGVLAIIVLFVVVVGSDKSKKDEKMERR